MQKRVGVAELAGRLRTVLDEVAREQVTYVLESNGRPEAAVIPYEEFLRLQRLAERERQRLERWDRSRARLAAANAHFTDEEIDADVRAAIAEVRAERRAREQARER